MTNDRTLYAPDASPSRGAFLASRSLTGLVVLVMSISGLAKIVHAGAVVQNFAEARLSPYLITIGLLEVAIAVLLAVPRTSSLGILLTTGYFGGAVVTHLEAGHPEQIVAPLVVGLVAWAAHYLRVREMFSSFSMR